MSRKKISESEVTDPEIWQKRRKLIKNSLILGTGLSMSGLYISRNNHSQAKHDQKNVPTDYRYITQYNNFYEMGTSKTDPAKHANSLQTRPWRIQVDGECAKPGYIDIEDILKFPQEERIYRFRCVEAWAMVVPWIGFSLSRLLKKFEPTSKAKFVRFETLYDPEQLPGQKKPILNWPYVEALRIDEAMHPLTLLATGLYGRSLPNQNGAPLRLVVPWKYGFKSIKSIVKIHFQKNRPMTTWHQIAPHEYGFYANVNPNVPHPRWSQKKHRVLGRDIFDAKQDTLLFNGYAEEVAYLYRGLDLVKNF